MPPRIIHNDAKCALLEDVSTCYVYLIQNNSLIANLEIPLNDFCPKACWRSSKQTLALGYSTPSNFIAMFRKIYGEAETHWAGDSSTSWQKHHKNNREVIANLALDTPYQTVLNKLSTPNFTELLKQDDGVYQVLFYATHSIHSDSKTTKDECTPLVFKNDKLIGVGDTIYKSLSNS